MRWGLGAFPSHFTDLLRARLSISITLSVFNKKGNSCLIALCNTSWQLMTKWEVEIGLFSQRSSPLLYPPTHCNELCDIAPRDLAWRTVLPKKVTVKALFDSFFPDLTIYLAWDPLIHPLTNPCMIIAHCLLSFHCLSMGRIKIVCEKISLEISYLKHGPTKTNIQNKPEVLLQSLSLSCILKSSLNLTCNR